jgi:hypothetical protein
LIQDRSLARNIDSKNVALGFEKRLVVALVPTSVRGTESQGHPFGFSIVRLQSSRDERCIFRRVPAEDPTNHARHSLAQKAMARGQALHDPPQLARLVDVVGFSRSLKCAKHSLGPGVVAARIEQGHDLLG